MLDQMQSVTGVDARIGEESELMPVVFASSAEEADGYRAALEEDGIAVCLGEAWATARKGKAMIPVLVPTCAGDRAAELIACLEAAGSDEDEEWEDDDAEEEEDDFFEDEDEDDDFLPDDEDEFEEDEEFEDDDS